MYIYSLLKSVNNKRTVKCNNVCKWGKNSVADDKEEKIILEVWHPQRTAGDQLLRSQHELGLLFRQTRNAVAILGNIAMEEIHFPLGLGYVKDREVRRRKRYFKEFQFLVKSLWKESLSSTVWENHGDEKRNWDACLEIWVSWLKAR